MRTFEIGDRVMSKNYVGPNKWYFGTIVKKLGLLHYIVKLDQNYTLKRHVNQLKRCEVEPKAQVVQPRAQKKVSFSLPSIVQRPVIALPNNTCNSQRSSVSSPEIIYSPLHNDDYENINPSEHNDNSVNINPLVHRQTINPVRSDIQSTRSMSIRRSERLRKPVSRLNL